MTIYEEAIAKIKQLPEPLVIEINDFIDFLILQHNPSQRELLQQLTQPLDDEVNFSEYLPNLEDYETRLANGEIYWEQ